MTTQPLFVLATRLPHGEVPVHFGDLDDCVRVLKSNMDQDKARHWAIRRASTEDIADRLRRLMDERAQWERDYQNAAWESGPRYRLEMDRLDGRIDAFRKILADMEGDNA